MKIYSWNVNGLRAVIRKGALNDFLAAEQPDVLCLQEIKARPDQVEIDLPDYTEYWNPATRPGYSGTAIFIRQNANNASSGRSSGPSLRASSLGPRRDCGSPSEAFLHFAQNEIGSFEGHPQLLRGRSEEPREDGRDERPENNQFRSTLTEGRVLTLDLGQFYLVNVYTPNSKPDLSRLQLRENVWDPAFLNYLRQLEQTKPVVTCGDFNAAHTELDLARPDTNHHNAGFTDEERQGIKNILQAGFIDTFRQQYPTTQRYTWWSHWGNARANNVGWRIDYFFISNSLLPHLIDANIHEHITGSDHCPISIQLDLPL